jgi:hypothetical protein
MMDMLFQGFIAAATVLYLISYIGFRRVFAFAFIVDTFVTLAFVIAFAGSYAGMMTGVIAGLTFSMFMRIGRRLVGVERVRFVRGYGRILPTLMWVRSK